MSKFGDFARLDADLEGGDKIEREKTLILLSVQLKETIKSAYGERMLGKILEAGALIKLRRDGHIPDKPRGAEPAGMETYVAAKKPEKVALEEIKERVEPPKKPKR